jgi:hypothetical protein
VRAGDCLAVGHRNQQHPAFVWSATEDGHHGWMPEEYIRVVDGRDGVALRDYDSTHLTVVPGEQLDVLERVDDYLLCRNVANVEGWVPASCVQDLEEER